MQLKKCLFILSLLLLWGISTRAVISTVFAKSYASPVIPTTQKTLNDSTIGVPLRVIIPDNNIDLTISSAPYKNGTWIAPNEGAGYATEASLAHKNGLIVLFSHARLHMFRNLKDVSIGTNVQVITNRGTITYTVTDSEIVLPTDVSALTSYGETNISLLTCEGPQDKYRRVVKGTTRSFEPFVHSEII